MEENKFQCEICKWVFDKDPEWDPMEEYRENFPDFSEADIGGVVCDDCYKMVLRTVE